MCDRVRLLFFFFFFCDDHVLLAYDEAIQNHILTRARQPRLRLASSILAPPMNASTRSSASCDLRCTGRCTIRSRYAPRCAVRRARPRLLCARRTYSSPRGGKLPQASGAYSAQGGRYAHAVRRPRGVRVSLGGDSRSSARSARSSR